VNRSDVQTVYSAKTDDELLALFRERNSLEAEAQSFLWTELHLTDPSQLRQPSPAEVPANPAFNSPAKIAYGILALACVGFLTAIIVAVANEHLLFMFIFLFALFWGTMFIALAWAIRHTLQNRSPRNRTRKEF